MARVSDFRLREHVANLELSPEELVELLEISSDDLIRKFTDKIRANMDKFGFDDSGVEE